MNNTTAIILAAGASKRLKPITTPKSLLPFFGKPLIHWLANDLKQAGVNNILVVVNKNYQDQFESLGLETSIQTKPTGMADALMATKSKIKTDSIMVINGGDLLASEAIKDFANKATGTENILLTGMKTDHYLPGGYFKFNQDTPIAIIEKPGEGKEPSPYYSPVMHYFRHKDSFFKELKKAKSSKDDLYEVALSKLMSQEKTDLFEYDDYFAQIKYPHQILDVTDAFLNHKKTDESIIHPTAKIMSGAIVKNSYIGKKVIIGNNCLIRDSIIEEGTVVGYNTEIARSYVGSQNWFHCNYVGDSVIEADSNLGSGARIANLRFDKKPIADTSKTKLGVVMAKGSQLGINTSVMPGISIGKNSLIGSGVVLYKSVGDNQKVFK